jgi:hypothetical protein
LIIERSSKKHIFFAQFFFLKNVWLDLLLDIRLFAHLSIGRHPWYVVVGTSGTSLFMFCMNLPFLIRTVRERR